MANAYEAEVDRLLRRVESRAEAKEQLRDTVKGVAATVLIFGIITGFFAAMLIGAMLFSAILEAWAR